MRAKNEYMLMSEAYSKVHGDEELINENLLTYGKWLKNNWKKILKVGTVGGVGIGGSLIIKGLFDFIEKNKWLIPVTAGIGGLYVANKFLPDSGEDGSTGAAGSTDINIQIGDDPEDDDIRDPEGFQKVDADDIVDTEEVQAVDAEESSLDSAEPGEAFLTTSVKDIAKDQGIEVNEEEDIVGYLQQFGQWQLLDTKVGQLAVKIA